MNKRNIFLYIEVMLLLAPITVALCYTSILTIFIGIPASIMQIFNDGEYPIDLLLSLSVIANILGGYALVILWTLVKRTLNNQKYVFSAKFYIGVIAGILAIISLIILFKLQGLLLGAFPVLIVAIHFVWLQKKHNI